MYKMCNLLVKSLLFVLLLPSSFSFGQVSVSSPLIWNLKTLDYVKKENSLIATRKSILHSADKYCGLLPVVVTEKKENIVGDKHYFYQIRGYYWADSLHPDNFIKKDGYRNPTYKNYDFTRLTEMAKRCKYLSVAYYLTGKKEYYDAFKRQILAWFVDKDTYMYPNFRYATMLPNGIKFEGTASGLIEAYTFIDVLESLRLIDMVKPIDNVTKKELKEWFRQFVANVECDYGELLGKLKNNIGLAWDVTLMNMYLFIGESAQAKELANQFAEKWLYKHIISDGRQPLELKRASAFGYSVYNLTHIIDFCFLSRYWEMDFYQKHRQRIDKAFDFLEQFRNDTTSFPYSQVSSWGKCLNNLSRQELRLKRLRFHQHADFSNRKRLSIYQVLE